MFEGEIAAVDGRLITGWVAAPEGMAQLILIEFAVGEQVLGSTLAKLDMGAPQPRLVFEFLLPACLVDGRICHIEARIGGVPVELRNASHRIGTPAPLPDGYVDQISDEGWVRGWVWRPDQPEIRLEVEFLADDHVIGSAVAERSRPDVAEAGIGDGCYGFSWQLPYTVLASTREMIISVRDKATGTVLPKPISFQSCNSVETLTTFAAQQMDTRPDEAEAALQEALLLAPENVQVHIGLALCARKRGDYAVSFQHGEAAARLVPGDAWRWLEVAQDLQALGRLVEAEQALQEALLVSPAFWHANVVLGSCARARGDYAEALKQFEAAAAAAPDDAWRWLDVAEAFRALGRLEEAEAALQQALRLAPEIWQSHAGLGHCARARGDRAAALAHFEAAVRFAPGEIAPLLHIAEEQRDAGDFDAARHMVEALLCDYPANVQVYRSLAYIERQAGRHDEALGWFSRAHAIEPGNPVMLAELAQEEYALGRHDSSSKHLFQALEIDPSHQGAVVQRARQALAVGDVGQAYEIYREAANRRPDVMEFRFGVLDALAWMGRTGEALAGLAAIEAMNGSVSGLLARRITLLRHAGKYHEALQAARAATVAEPHQFWLWVERFNTELLVGEDAAVQKCLFGIPAETRHERAVQSRCFGALAESLWLIESAIGHYETAVVLNPDDAALQEALARSSLLVMDLSAARRYLSRYFDLIAPDRLLRGESLNISQSLLGQIIDEYAVDQQLADALAALRALPPGARIAKLRHLVLHYPDSTAAAVNLLVAMRQAGMLDYVLPSNDPVSIPKIITKFWHGHDVPDDVQALIETWREMNPGYQLRLFNDTSARDYLAAHFPQDVLAAYARARELTQKADIFRLALLVAEGGVYSDVDDRCLKPVETIIPQGVPLVLHQDNLGFAGNNFIAVVPNCPVLAAALEAVVTAVNRGDNEIPWLLSGPGLLTRALARHLAISGAVTSVPAGLALLDRRALNQVVASECFATYKVYKLKSQKG